MGKKPGQKEGCYGNALIWRSSYVDLLGELASHHYPWPGSVRELKKIIESTPLELCGKNVGMEGFIQRIKSKGDYIDHYNGNLILTRKEAILFEDKTGC